MLWCNSVFTQLLPKPPGRNVKSPLRLSEASAFFLFSMLLLKSHVLVKLLLSSVFFSLYNFFWFDYLVDWTGLQISAIQTGCWIAQIFSWILSGEMWSMMTSRGCTRRKMLALKEQQAALHCFVLYCARVLERIPFSIMVHSEEPQGQWNTADVT